MNFCYVHTIISITDDTSDNCTFFPSTFQSQKRWIFEVTYYLWIKSSQRPKDVIIPHHQFLFNQNHAKVIFRVDIVKYCTASPPSTRILVPEITLLTRNSRKFLNAMKFKLYKKWMTWNVNLGLPRAESSVEKSLKGPKKWSDKKIITPHNRIFKKEVKSSYTNTVFHSVVNVKCSVRKFKPSC